jgi:ferric-dicitrate binding protein FerR (iron transport regulator)
MKDYKGRGSNLKFRDRKRTPWGRLLQLALLLLSVAVAAVLGFNWLDTSGEPQAVPTATGTVGTGIPLTLPPAPASYGAEQSVGS